MKKLLLTGGTGFIGSHTCLSLLEQKYEVLILDSCINSSAKSLNGISKILGSKNPINKSNLEFIRGDISDESLLKDIFIYASKSDKPIEGVIHFAGLKSLSESVNNPIKYWESNVLGTINLLKVMDSFNCRKIIFSSSASIYQSNNGLINEDSFLKPITPYGSTKATIEIFLRDLFDFQKGNWNIINLRYFNPIGAHPSGIMGEEKTKNTNNIFPLIIDAAFSSEKTLQIFGDDWETFDGTCIRDFIHVMDVAEAHIKAYQFLNNDRSMLLNLNIGTGKGTSILELVKAFERVNNVKINYVFNKRRVGDNPFLVADNSLAKRILNWEPKNTIEDMCRDGWKWKIINPKGYV